jgi:chromosome segregation ATPase
MPKAQSKPAAQQPQRLLGLAVKDFKNVEFRALKFASDSGVVTIQSPNEGGKSAIADALELVLRNKQFKAPPGGRVGDRPDYVSPVRRGAEVAVITAAFKDYTLEMHIPKDGEPT